MVVSGGTTTSNGFSNAMQFRFSNYWGTLNSGAPNPSPNTSLKTPLAKHCMAQMDSVSIVVTGGIGTGTGTGTAQVFSQKSNFYNLTTNTWSDFAPNLLTPRGEHGCSFIAGEDGKPTAIIAGGKTNVVFSLLQRLKTVEIYNRALNIWESGPTMLQHISNFMVSIFIINCESTVGINYLNIYIRDHQNLNFLKCYSSCEFVHYMN